MQQGLQIGPYTVERELGRGGMGAVYLGRLSPTSEPVAIKVIHADLSFDDDLAARFEREGAALERLSHPNLVALRGRGIYRGGRWLAMDFVAGSSLAERLKSKGPWPSHAARELMISLCAGIEHAHQAGILHRDLKPDNVLLRAQDGQALIADFGLALPLDVSQHLTQTGEILGSPGYLAPEQCGMPIPTSAATDVYGLGALLYTVLTGQPPISGASLLGMLDNVLNAPPRPPSELVEHLDPTLEAICLRCLAKEPSERYPSIADLRAALEAEPQVEGPTSRPRLWVALAGGVALAAGIVGSQLGGSPPSPSPSPPFATPTSSPPEQPTTSPSPTPLASPADSPSSPDPKGQVATEIEAALAERNWNRARALLTQVAGPERHWLRYQALEAELNWTGSESQPWRKLKQRALVELKSRTDPWRLALRAAIYLLTDERIRSIKVSNHSALLRQLEAGTSAAESPAQKAALWRAVVSLLRLQRADPSATLDAIKRWEEAGGVTWRTELYRARAHFEAQQGRLYLQALNAGEFATYSAGHPWARFEFYRHRLPRRAAPSRTNAWLCEAILASQAPDSLKAESALELADYWLRLGRLERASRVLRSHLPPPEAPVQIRAAHWQARAILDLESGRPRALLALLDGPNWLTGPNLRYRDQLLRAAAHALLRENQLATRALEGAQPPPTRDPVIQLLELRAWILLDRRERALKLTQELVSSHDDRLLLSTAVVLDRLQELKAPGDEAPFLTDSSLARKVGEALELALEPERFQTANSLISDGRWETAVDLLARLHSPEAPPTEDEQIVRTCYLALRRGLEEVPPGASRWQAAYERVRRLVEAGSCEKPRPALLALLESLTEVTPKRRAELVRALEEASQRAPLWEEFSEATARVRRRSFLDQDPTTRPRRHAEFLWALRTWVKTFPSSHEALYHHLTLIKGSPEDLSSLEVKLSQHSSLGVRTRLATRSKWHALGRLSHDDFLLACFGLTSGTLNPPPRDRRRSLVLIAGSLPPETPDRALHVQRILDWSDAVTGPPLPTKDPSDAFVRSRYLSLRARSALARGRVREALTLAQGFEPYPVLLGPEFKAAHAVLRGQIELRAGVEGGLKRIEHALKEWPTREGFLILARASEGETRALAYERALTFSAQLEEIDALLREIEAAGLDPAPMVARSMRALEALDSSRALAFGATLFASRPGPERALLLWEALRVEELRDLPQGKLFRAQEAELLRAALKELPANTQALIRAQDELEAANEAKDPKRVRACLEALLALPCPPEVGDRLRVPTSVAGAYFDLEDEAEGQEHPGERILEDYVARGTAPLRIAFWLAERYRERGELERAARLTSNRDDPTKVSPGFSISYAFQQALDACAQGLDDRALELLHDALTGRYSAHHVSEVHLLLSQIWRRRGELRESHRALRTAREYCPKESRGLATRLLLEEGRLRLARGEVKDARLLFEPFESGDLSKLAPGLRSYAKALEAAILNAEEEHQQALIASEAALSHRPREVLAHLERLTALVGLGKQDQARAEAQGLLQGALLTPGSKGEVKAWLAALQGR